MTLGWFAPALLVAMATQAAPPDVEKEVLRLAAQLDGDSLPDREAAETALIRLGRPAVPALKRLFSTAVDEPRWRLERAIKAITQPRWIVDFDAALRKSRETGKPLFIFSTIGDVDGYV